MSYEKVTQLKLQSRIIIGTKQTLKAMNNGEVERVYIAEDADQHVTSRVLEEAKKLQIPHVMVDSKKKLGIACNIEVDASTVAIRRE